MPDELDPAVAEGLMRGAMGSLPVTHGKKILCTKRQVQECLLALAQEAYAMGFLSGQKEQFGALVAPGAAERPPWMDLPLDNPETLATCGLRLRPRVVRSLLGAGYRSLGDLCWVSEYELRNLSYIGRITTREIVTAIRKLRACPHASRAGLSLNHKSSGRQNREHLIQSE